MGRMMIALMCCAMAKPGSSQPADTLQVENTERVAKNTVYLELMGNGVWYSINYDRILFYGQYFKITIRIGGMLFPVDDEINAAFPLEVNGLAGGNSNLEMGLGVTVAVPSRVGLLEPYRFVFRIGYRWQKVSGGLFFRAGTLLFVNFTEQNYDKNWPLIPSIGLGVGYTLKKK